MKLPIVRPSFPRLDSFADAFEQSLRSGVVTNGGQHVQAFEAALSEYLGAPTICFNNGHTALMAMLRAGIRACGEIVLPSFTFVSTIHAVHWAGAKPVFADIDPETLTLDPLDVVRKVTDRTVAILGVDAYGICCDYEALQEIADRSGAMFLCDSAPAFGSEYRGVLTGYFAEAQMFSFHATKPFAVGEGGAICSENEQLIERARRIRNFGQGPDGTIAELGLNGKMQEVCALIGLEQLKDWPERRADRIDSAARLAEGLAEIGGVTVIKGPGSQEPIWCYRPILIDPFKFDLSRDQVIERLHKRGVMARKYYWPPLHGAVGMLPVTERVANQVIALPLYDRMFGGEIDMIEKSLRDIRDGK